MEPKNMHRISYRFVIARDFEETIVKLKGVNPIVQKTIDGTDDFISRASVDHFSSKVKLTCR